MWSEGLARKMNIPNLLKPKTGIEEKTDQLMEEAKIIPSRLSDVELSEILTKVRNQAYPDEDLQFKVKNLLKGNGYKKIRKKQLNGPLELVYWSKPDTKERSRILIQKKNLRLSTLTPPTDYVFKIVDNKDIKRFYKKLEKYEIYREPAIKQYISMPLLCGLIGTGLGALSSNFFSAYLGLAHPEEVRLIGFSLIAGYFAGGLAGYGLAQFLDLYSVKRYENKKREFYRKIETDNKTALEEAIS